MKSAIRNIIVLASMAFAVTAWGQNASVTVGSGSGLPGDTGIVIPVNLTAGQDIAGIDLTVTFTTAAQYSSITVDCGAATVSPNLFDSCSVAGNVVSITMADTKATTWIDGLLANITVDIDGAATPLINDPLAANMVGAGDTTGTDLSPLPGTTDGAFTVLAGPQPAYASSPTPAAGISLAVAQNDPDPSQNVTITNSSVDPEPTTLTGSCGITVDPDSVFSISGDTAFSVAQGAAGDVVTVTCDSAGAIATHTGTMECSHNGSGAGEASPAVYDLSCNITAAPPAIYDSAPKRPGSTIEMTPGGDVPVGAVVRDWVLTISNIAKQTNASSLALTNCGFAPGSSAAITATAPATPLAPLASTDVTFSCSTASVGNPHTGTYSCDYDVNDDATNDGTAIYTVNCGVRAAASDIKESPPSGTDLRILVPPGGTLQTSVNFAEILDEGEDATVDTCTFGGTAFTVITTLPLTVPAGPPVPVMVEGTDPADGSVTVEDTLTCTYTDSDSDPGTANWPITMTIQTIAIPTLSEWGLIVLFLAMLGLGGMVIRRRAII